jgi:hypothetical protein
VLSAFLFALEAESGGFAPFSWARRIFPVGQPLPPLPHPPSFLLDNTQATRTNTQHVPQPRGLSPLPLPQPTTAPPLGQPLLTANPFRYLLLLRRGRKKNLSRPNSQ